ncbi:MAG TPA: outer membrane beta-barrel protein [Candidatus Angelobacter sp.]|jgi:hypothetical protein|nr:outer membrane beta-barrel protein [Candidatus Angelobacter sp.]
MQRSTVRFPISFATLFIFTVFFFPPCLLFAQAPVVIQSLGNLPAPESNELRELREAVRELRAEVAELRDEIRKQRQTEQPPTKSLVETSSRVDTSLAQPGQNTISEAHKGLDLLRDATLEVGLDGYYGYNFNNPIGRVNLARAYDVSSNAFSLNQASVILKLEPDVAAGRRFGARIDLQYGQATETLQGNASNELRPDAYRPIFQAYGTYVFPLGKGLTVDFGKWASSLGYENNYGKDQLNYSRSLWFDALPFYHAGVRANYKFNDTLGVNYWATNGTQQTEPFNGFKDQLFGITLQPHKTLSATLNYYLGQEHPDVIFFTNGSAPAGLPTQQGIPFLPLTSAPNGRLHIFDSYLNWQATPRLTLAFEGDLVIQRLLKESPPAHFSGGALYARYQLSPKTWVGTRSEYLSDRGGLFSGKPQALKEVTLTYDYKLAEGFMMRTEWRRDFSNLPFFLTDRLGVLSQHQNTATMGLIWWWGNKEETW